MLGRTGIKTPLISLGAGGAYDPNFVRAVYDAGVKLFFSATYYGEGNNEKMVGEGLKGLPRDSFIVGTAANPDNFDTRTGKFTAPLDVGAYIRKAEASIARFGLDYVDIFMFPFAGKRETMMNESLLQAMKELKRKGRVRYGGIATHSDCEEALRSAADSDVYEIVMTAYNYKTKNKDAFNEALDYAVKKGIGVVAMKTTAGETRNKSGAKPLNTDAALKWVLQNKNVSSIVSGMTSLEQLRKNISILGDLKLTKQELEDLDLALSGPEPGLYCHQCRQCVPQCQYKLEIPSAMRSYMYAYGYRNTKLAKAVLRDSGVDGRSCVNCTDCSVKCSAGFDVKEKIRDISRLNEIPDDFLIA